MSPVRGNELALRWSNNQGDQRDKRLERRDWQ